MKACTIETVQEEIQQTIKNETCCMVAAIEFLEELKMQDIDDSISVHCDVGDSYAALYLSSVTIEIISSGDDSDDIKYSICFSDEVESSKSEIMQICSLILPNKR